MSHSVSRTFIYEFIFPYILVSFDQALYRCNRPSEKCWMFSQTDELSSHTQRQQSISNTQHSIYGVKFKVSTTNTFPSLFDLTLECTFPNVATDMNWVFLNNRGSFTWVKNTEEGFYIKKGGGSGVNVEIKGRQNKERKKGGTRRKSLSHCGTGREQNLTVQINLESLQCRGE